jgi:IS5 family transposase
MSTSSNSDARPACLRPTLDSSRHATKPTPTPAGVKRVSIPNRSTKSAERKKLQKLRWFRSGQKWRTGAEGRISLLKRRHGLNRCRYKGPADIRRWVGLGVIGDNLINVGRALAASAKR